MQKPKFNIENIVIGVKIPAIRKLSFNEINKIILKGKLGFQEVLREDTSTPMLKLKLDIEDRKVHALLWVNQNKIQFMGLKKKKDAIECYEEIIKELSELTRGFLES